MTDDAVANIAKQLIDDARRDRDVLRRRWLARPAVRRIVDVLERHPSLLPAVQQFVDGELARLGEELSPELENEDDGD